MVGLIAVVVAAADTAGAPPLAGLLGRHLVRRDRVGLLTEGRTGAAGHARITQRRARQGRNRAIRTREVERLSQIPGDLPTPVREIRDLGAEPLLQQTQD